MIFFLGCISDFRFIHKGSFNVSEQTYNKSKESDVCECAEKSRSEPSYVAYHFDNATKDCVLYTKLGDIINKTDHRAYIKDNEIWKCPENVLCMSYKLLGQILVHDIIDQLRLCSSSSKYIFEIGESTTDTNGGFSICYNLPVTSSPPPANTTTGMNTSEAASSSMTPTTETTTTTKTTMPSSSPKTSMTPNTASNTDTSNATATTPQMIDNRTFCVIYDPDTSTTKTVMKGMSGRFL